MHLNALRIVAAIVVAGSTTVSFAQAPSSTLPGVDGEAVFRRACSACHLPGAPADSNSSSLPLDGRAASREQLRRLTPEAILNALTNGKMQVQGANLNDAERRAVAEVASGRSFEAASAADVATVSNLCRDTKPM